MSVALKGQRHAAPFELDLALQVLEEDEVLQQDVASEVAVAELQVHQLESKKHKEGIVTPVCWVLCYSIKLGNIKRAMIYASLLIAVVAIFNTNTI